MVRCTFLFWLLLSAFGGMLKAQSFKEGMISFRITYPSLSAELKQQEEYLPQNLYVLLKNHMTRLELKTIMGPMITITNNKSGEVVILTEMLGKKLAMKSTVEDSKRITKKVSPDMTKRVEETGETKTIAGYLCKKARVHITTGGKTQSSDIYYAPDISPMYNDTYNNGFDIIIPGFIMQYSIVQEGLETTFTAIKVEQKPVSDSVFDIPAGYEIMPRFAN
jgi:GLPGLI family protein